MLARAEAEAAANGKEAQGQNMEPVKDINAIMKTLPHRCPSLLPARILHVQHHCTTRVYSAAVFVKLLPLCTPDGGYPYVVIMHR